MKTILQAKPSGRAGLFEKRSKECEELARIGVNPKEKAAYLALAENYARLAKIESDKRRT